MLKAHVSYWRVHPYHRILFCRLVGNTTAFEGIKALCEEGLLNEAIKAIDQLDERNPFLSMKLFDCLLDCCASKADLVAGREVHHLIIRSGFESDAFLGRRLIRMFVSCGSLSKANEVFGQLLEPNVFTWSAIILAHVKLGQGEQTIELFHRMQLSNVRPDPHTYVAILKACSSMAALSQGKIIHLYFIEENLKANIVLGNALISMYVSCGAFEDARRVFVDLQERDVVSWNAMIGGYAQHECVQEALDLFQQMLVEGIDADSVTYISILKVCTVLETFNHGKWIHGLLLERGVVLKVSVGNTLIDMYAKCGSLKEACRVFWEMPTRTVVTWSALIDAHGQHGHALEALQLFEQMKSKGMDPDEILLASVLRSCADVLALDHGRYIHAYIIKKGYDVDVVVGSSLVSLYCRCGSLDDARATFVELQDVNVVTWSALIAGYAQHGQCQDALSLFSKMQHEGVEPNQVTYLSVLKICTNLVDLFCGILLHDQIIKRGFGTDVFVMSALIKLYISCGRLRDARRVFGSLVKQNVVTWNVMLAGYAQQEQGGEVVQLFLQMHEEGVDPNEITFIIVLKACSIIAALEQGMMIHGHIVEKDFQADIHVGSILIMMYTMCGSLKDGCKVFEEWPKDDVATWNAIITGCAQHKDYNLALQYFEYMKKKCLKPNGATFVSLLSACSYTESVDAAVWLFKVMTQDFCIVPASNHYECLVNLLGRAGHLSDAENLLATMPSLPSQVNHAGWVSLLSHCRANGNVEIGKRCFDYWVARDGKNAAGYLLMSNIYADAGMWGAAEKLEKLRKRANAWKKPGKASVEVENGVHEFTVGGGYHPQCHDVEQKLRRLNAQIKDEGYLPSSDTMLQPMLDEVEEARKLESFLWAF